MQKTVSIVVVMSCAILAHGAEMPAQEPAVEMKKMTVM
jgi:hypothetical protein